MVLLCNNPRHLQTLEVNLGPDVGDVQMRIGLNSGAITAPVLRREKGRLQLFGDTVNMAARMEANRFSRSSALRSSALSSLLAASRESHRRRRRQH